MCGIIGFTGHKNAVPILIKGLRALEYRGYDSSGISVFDKSGMTTIKAKGRIDNTEKKIKKEHNGITSSCGIGHTRWATHGEPSDINSHPHTTDNIALVHNGIIENYAELRTEMSEMGYKFSSETDTEAAVMLIDSFYRISKDPVIAIYRALEHIRGSYAFGIMFRDHPGIIYAIKKDSPLICAKSSIGYFIASDIPALLEYTDEIFTMQDGELAILSKDKISFSDSAGNRITKTSEKSDIGMESAKKDGFAHYMLKEIFQQPDVIRKTFKEGTKEGLPDLGLNGDRLKNCGRIHIVACGTAMHAGLIGKYFIEKYARIPVDVSIASEFRYSDPVLGKNDIFVALSQSGETADTVAAMRLAKSFGLYTVAIVNVKGSTIAREADTVIYTHAGPEIAVASTKAYTVQCCTLYLLALRLAFETGMLSPDVFSEAYNKNTGGIISGLRDTLRLSDNIRGICRKFSNTDDVFFIGRGIDSYLSAEASLKLKEISYIHSEAYAAGELKHGTISLVCDGTPVVAVITEQKLFEKTVSNIKEVKARGADVTVICDGEISIPEDIYDDIIKVPHLPDGLSFLCAAVAFQLLAYHTADIRGCDIDKPRNLAKSVTVE